jgi:pyrimidine operon attenuation protein/uracil phosphoribosyltransferase
MNKKIVDAKGFKTLLDRMVEQFVQDHQSALKEKKVGIVGIHTRGAVLAKRITKIIEKQYHFQVAAGSLDITLYRDDVGEIGNQPLVKETDIPFSVEGKVILLVDDVLYTGRTIRAALDALLELGRPRAVRLAVAVDRGERELPVQADYTGTGMQVKSNEKIQIQLKESDGKDGIWITQR